VWRTLSEACFRPTVKHHGGFIMVWCRILWYLSPSLVPLDGSITAAVFNELLSNQVHPVVQTLFPDGNTIYQEYNPPIHTSGPVWESFHEQADGLNIFRGLRSPQTWSFSLCGLFRKPEFGVDFHLLCLYLSWSPCCMKNGFKFHSPRLSTCIDLFRPELSCIAC